MDAVEVKRVAGGYVVTCHARTLAAAMRGVDALLGVPEEAFHPGEYRWGKDGAQPKAVAQPKGSDPFAYAVAAMEAVPNEPRAYPTDAGLLVHDYEAPGVIDVTLPGAMPRRTEAQLAEAYRRVLPRNGPADCQSDHE